MDKTFKVGYLLFWYFLVCYQGKHGYYPRGSTGDYHRDFLLFWTLNTLFTCQRFSEVQ